MAPIEERPDDRAASAHTSEAKPTTPPQRQPRTSDEEFDRANDLMLTRAAEKFRRNGP